MTGEKATKGKTASKGKTSTRKGAKKSDKASKDLAVLKSQVAKLSKISYDKVDFIHTSASSTSVATPYFQALVSGGLNTMAPLWGYSSTDVANADKAYLNSKDVYVSVRQNNEPNLIRYTMFVVSLKDAGADSTTFDPLTGSLTLANGTHYTNIVSDQVRISPRFFNIHAMRRFTMGYEGTAGPTADTVSERRFVFKLKPKQKLINNPKGNVFGNASFTFPKDPSQNYWVLLFNDNASADLENNKVDINTVDHFAIAS